LKTELDILKDVVKKLDEVNIPYMLTGSLAMMHYAQPRMTRDIDLVIELNKAHVENFLHIFTNEYYVSREAVEDSIEHSYIFNLIHLESSIKVDFIVRKPEEYRIVEFGRREKIAFSNTEIVIVSKEDLILSKLIWAKESKSDLQLKDVKNLLGTGYNEKYLFEWSKKLELFRFLMEVING
jgi:Nucleotidyl transferase AbiEii toxin, Type IV TA system